MGWIYEKILRRGLFTLEAEQAHELAIDALAVLARLTPLCRVLERLNRVPPDLFKPVEAFGLKFPNAVGLAAGFDKNARVWPAIGALGFGHVEIGTVTALPQPGNDRPRMFRYPEVGAVINRMGFNNQGSEAVAARLVKQARVGQRSIPLGINLGKSKITDISKATADYLTSFSRLADFADYIVLNVSSPNTPGLRQLQDEDRLTELLSAVASANQSRQTRVPVLLKIAPDLNFRQVDAVLTRLFEYGFDGIIATNTTIERSGPMAAVKETGGLSGRPLRQRSTAMINYIARTTGGRLPIIGVGGIEDATSAGEKMDAGATLIQIYTGMIFRGPFLARELAFAVADAQR